MTRILIALSIGYVLGVFSMISIAIYLADKKDQQEMDLNSNE